VHVVYYSIMRSLRYIIINLIKGNNIIRFGFPITHTASFTPMYLLNTSVKYMPLMSLELQQLYLLMTLNLRYRSY